MSSDVKVYPYLDSNGREVPDPNPRSVPVKFSPSSPLHKLLADRNRVADLIRHELSNQAAEAGNETFEESDDFEVGDEDDDFTSPYELNFDHVNYDHRRDANLAPGDKRMIEEKPIDRSGSRKKLTLDKSSRSSKGSKDLSQSTDGESGDDED